MSNADRENADAGVHSEAAAEIKGVWVCPDGDHNDVEHEQAAVVASVQTLEEAWTFSGLKTSLKLSFLNNFDSGSSIYFEFCPVCMAMGMH